MEAEVLNKSISVRFDAIYFCHFGVHLPRNAVGSSKNPFITDDGTSTKVARFLQGDLVRSVTILGGHTTDDKVVTGSGLVAKVETQSGHWVEWLQAGAERAGKCHADQAESNQKSHCSAVQVSLQRQMSLK